MSEDAVLVEVIRNPVQRDFTSCRQDSLYFEHTDFTPHRPTLIQKKWREDGILAGWRLQITSSDVENEHTQGLHDA